MVSNLVTVRLTICLFARISSHLAVKGVFCRAESTLTVEIEASSRKLLLIYVYFVEYCSIEKCQVEGLTFLDKAHELVDIALLFLWLL